MKLHLSKLPPFDAANHKQGSSWWQFCILLKNMEDPRFAGGVNILTTFQALIVLVLFTGAYFYWTAPANCPTPKGVLADERTDG